MHTQDCVVGLDHSSSHLRAAPHGEGDLALLAIIHGQPCKPTEYSKTVRLYRLYTLNRKPVISNPKHWKQNRSAQPKQPLEHEAAKT